VLPHERLEGGGVAALARDNELMGSGAGTAADADRDISVPLYAQKGLTGCREKGETDKGETDKGGNGIRG
jgi:hypothetical protein